jgi:hypothetical protein
MSAFVYGLPPVAMSQSAMRVIQFNLFLSIGGIT